MWQQHAGYNAHGLLRYPLSHHAHPQSAVSQSQTVVTLFSMVAVIGTTEHVSLKTDKRSGEGQFFWRWSAKEKKHRMQP